MRALYASLVAVACLLTTAPISHATSLQISPVRLDIKAPRATEIIRLRNRGMKAMNVQVRIFRWIQIDGKDQLVPTRDVVASPPFAKLAPNSEYVLRVIRITKHPVASEESYRLLIDQLPDTRKSNGRAVKFVLRQSLPVFFGKPSISRPAVKWAVEKHEDKLLLKATNTGDRHLRLSGLNVTNLKGLPLLSNKELSGYVLGHSTQQWTVRGVVKGVQRGSLVKIKALSNGGPVKGTAKLELAK